MFTRIRKRDGRIVEFDTAKITNAIAKAGLATGEFDRDIAEKLTIKVLSVAQTLIRNEIPTVEEIQDVVEEVLLSSPYRKTAKAYIIYRDQHAKIREISTKASVDLVEQYLEKLDWQVQENSNMTFSLQGLNNYISSEISKVYWLNRIYPPEIRSAHINGDFHIHDLNSLSVYCVGWDLQDLLIEGFRGVSGKAESKPARHFRSALGQIVNFFYTLQGEAAGAQAFSSFDTLLAPFIRFDNLNYKEVKQALQEFIFNVNVPTRVGFQTPFSNLTLDLKVPDFMKDQPVIIGGKPQDATYKEFQEEMDIINRAFLEVMLEGDAKGRVFTFPIPTYNITKDFDWNNSNLDLLWEVTAKYGIPYFSNFINSSLRPEDARSMCLHPDEPIIIRIDGRIIRTTIGELANNFAMEYDEEGWADTSSYIEALSFNPASYRVEWKSITRFYRTYDDYLVTIETYDGKKLRVSRNHPVAVYTEEGIRYKKALELNEKDILLVLRNAEDTLNQDDIYIGDYKLDEELGFLMGLFISDGNYIYDNRENSSSFGKEKGIQFTFNDEDTDLIEMVQDIVSRKFNYTMKFRKDPRYEHSLYGYIYNAELARLLAKNRLEKYGGVPDIIFNARKEVIESFLDGIFSGDGYRDGNEIHINDKKLAEDLIILYSLVGIPTTIRYRENSQVIRLQHVNGRGSRKGKLICDILYNRVPQYVVETGRDKPFYNKTALVCKSSLDKYKAHTDESLKILSSDTALVRIRSIKIENLPYKQDFYDIELSENHYFVHSLGNITHNCCRLQLNVSELRNRGGGLFGSNPLTGSIGVVTINMPRLGYLSKDEDEFLARLERLMNLAKQSLEIKRKVLEKFTERDLYPYSKFYLREVKKRFGEYWKNHFSTIGLIGMNEACLNLIGEDIATKDGQYFTLKVLEFMRNKLIEFQEETGNMYNLEATPGEGTSYRLARIDKNKYLDIICGNEAEYRERSAEPFYTNSTQLPVDFTDDVFTALDLQDEIQTMYTGGTVFHIFVGERIEDPESVKVLIRRICENYRLPYITLTPTFSICPSHGYIAGEHYECPKCKSATEVYSRVVGYLRPVSQWNKGKQEEFKLRKTFKAK